MAETRNSKVAYAPGPGRRPAGRARRALVRHLLAPAPRAGRVLGGAIDDEIANLVVAQLLHLEAEDPDKDIQLYVNSPGGDVYAGLAIYDTMRFIKPDVATTCCGIAMSMGSLILAGGAAGKRSALPNSRILIHQPSGGFQGQATDIQIHAKEALELRGRVEEIYAQHTGHARADLRRPRARPLLHARRGAGLRAGRPRLRRATNGDRVLVVASSS